MSTFQITEEVAPMFGSDLEFIRAQTVAALERMLSHGDPAQRTEAIEEAARHAHTLKGLAAMIGATGLSSWGHDLGCLWEAAPTFLQSAPEKAEPMAQFVLSHSQGAWAEMNRLTLAGEFAEALTIYLWLRAHLDTRWGGYLTDPAESGGLPMNIPLNAPSGAEANAPTDAPILNGCSMPISVVPPLLKRRGLNERSWAPIARPEANSASPMDVVPPALMAKAAPAAEAAPERPAMQAALPELIAPTLRAKGSFGLAPVVPPAVIVEPVAGPVAEVGGPPPAPAEPSEDLHAVLQEEISVYLIELARVLKGLSVTPGAASAWEQGRRIFHTIKGAAATVGIETVAAAAKRGEARCLVAMEDANARDYQSAYACAERAGEIASLLALKFDLALAPPSEPVAAPSLAEEEPRPDAELVEFFAAEAIDQAEAIERAILAWERGEEPAEQISAARRAFHTIKGAANSLGLRRLGGSVHHAEELMEHASDGRVAAKPELFAFLLRGTDDIRAYARALAAGQSARWEHDWAAVIGMLFTAAAAAEPARVEEPAAFTSASAPVVPFDEGDQTVRVETPRLHRLMSLVGEMVTDRSRLRRSLDRLAAFQAQLRERNQSLSATVSDFQQQFEFNLLSDRGETPHRARPGAPIGHGGGVSVNGASGEFSELEFDRYDQFSILSRSLVEMAHDIDQVLRDMSECVEGAGSDNTRFSQTSKLLQGEISGLSLVPVAALQPRLNRAFRDAAHSEGKRADLIFEGASVEVDKAVTDKIYVPLLHLLRNAVAHGIESAERRAELGKPERGQVWMRTSQAANQFVIRLKDDGGGLNLEAIRGRAVERGLLPADAPTLTIAQAVGIIFQHGFSTAASISSVAGRGVGLDVVREEVENLNGSIDYTAAQGEGAEWTIRLPLSISITEATIAEAGGTQFALPLNFVESGLILASATTRGAKGEELYQHGSELLPVLRLREVLRLPGEVGAATRGIIVAAGGRRAIVFVERVLARQEIVVKELDSLMRAHPLLTGGTVDADGRVIPILNVPALLAYNETAAAHTPQVVRRVSSAAHSREGALRVLIVDDSLSVRKVQTRLLTTLGCDVTAANDGLDAMEQLRAQRFDLIFTDLEMPRVNGYELIAEIRANPLWASLPTVVISSRGADKYINKAMSIGATTFLSKPFTEEQLSTVLAHYAGWNPGSRSRIAALAGGQDQTAVELSA